MKKIPASTDEYIASCPLEIQPRLQELRATIRAAAPDAEERISYGMPGLYQQGNVVWFAAARDHIGFYPTGEGIEAFKKELAKYETSKGTVRFPLDKPLPLKLIARITKSRVAANLKKAEAKTRKKK